MSIWPLVITAVGCVIVSTILGVILKMKCGWFNHTWGKWQDTHSGGVVDTRGVVTGYYIQQERRCTECHRVQVRMVEAHAK